MDTIGGVLFAKFLNLFRKVKVNTMIGEQVYRYYRCLHV